LGKNVFVLTCPYIPYIPHIPYTKHGSFDAVLRPRIEKDTGCKRLAPAGGGVFMGMVACPLESLGGPRHREERQEQETRDGTDSTILRLFFQCEFLSPLR
jgi:hypothetical protein